MPTIYPAQIDNSISLPAVIDNYTPVGASTVNNIRAAVLAIEGALGTRPQGLVYGTVTNRISALESAVVSGGISFGGDLSGTNLVQTVVNIQGFQIQMGSPSAGQVLGYNGNYWSPTTPTSFPTSLPPNGPAGGDLGGIYPNPTVTKVNGITITGTPSIGQILTATSTTAANWQPLSINASGSVIIFQPGGVAAGNVYTTESDLSSAIVAINGPVTLFFDLSLVSFSYTFITVGLLNLGIDTYWTDEYRGSTLNFANETTLQSPPVSINGFINILVSQATTICTLTDSVVTIMKGETSINSTSGFFVDSSSFNWTIWMYGQSSIGGSSSQIINNDVEINLFDGSFIGSFTGTIGSVFPNSFSSSAVIDPSYYPQTTIAGLYIDQSVINPISIPPNNINDNASYLLTGDTLYWTTGTAWIPLSGSNVLLAGTATYTQSSFSANTTILLDEQGNSFVIPIGMAFNLNIRTLITGPNGNQPAVFIDELIIQGASDSSNLHTILDSTNIKSFTGGEPWTVTYALTGTIGASALTITINKNSGPSPMNAISLVTFVRITGSANTNAP